MSTPQPQKFTIVDGPSAGDMAFSLQKCYSERPYYVEMTYGEKSAPANKTPVVITALEHEDNSGHKWMFKGFSGCVNNRKSKWLYRFHDRVEGYYNSATRKGIIKEFPPVN